jgi:hypothetical protein
VEADPADISCDIASIECPSLATAAGFGRNAFSPCGLESIPNAAQKLGGRILLRLHRGATAAMESKWQPIEIAKPAMVRTTEAIDDLDAVGLLEERL